MQSDETELNVMLFESHIHIWKVVADQGPQHTLVCLYPCNTCSTVSFCMLFILIMVDCHTELTIVTVTTRLMFHKLDLPRSVDE